jgi:hypothetical protein
VHNHREVQPGLAAVQEQHQAEALPVPEARQASLLAAGTAERRSARQEKANKGRSPRRFRWFDAYFLDSSALIKLARCRTSLTPRAEFDLALLASFQKAT